MYQKIFDKESLPRMFLNTCLYQETSLIFQKIKIFIKLKLAAVIFYKNLKRNFNLKNIQNFFNSFRLNFFKVFKFP